MGSSQCNQGRLHSGYHYPRSSQTAILTADCAPSFVGRYPGAIDHHYDHYYAIAREDSLTSATEYLAFCDALDLEYTIESPGVLDCETVQLCIRTPEGLINIERLRSILRDELTYSPIDVHLSTQATPEMLADHDLVVDATYGHWQQSAPLQWEVCEIAVVQLPREFAGVSLVVLDGDFFSLDPIPATDTFRLYHVRHSVHHANVGLTPDKTRLISTNYPSMLQSARQFLPALSGARYLKSEVTVRAVLPGVEATDERPTSVTRSGNTISIFSGKIDTAVRAAEEVVALAAS